MNDVVAKKLEEFFSQFPPKQYKKGELLIRADEAPRGIFYLQTGTVKMYLISRNGDEIVLNLFKPISFFPMSWAINNTSNPYFFEAMDTVTVVRAPKEKVLEFLHDNPDVVFDLLARLYRGMDGVLSRISYLMAGNAYTRLIAELLITAKRFGSVEKEGISFKITEKDLSASTGMSRETVSREIKILKDNGLVKFQRNELRINSIEDLEKELARDF